MKEGKIYLPNLDGIRFLAASMVMVHHVEQFKSLYNIQNIWELNVIKTIGKLGVILFFVMSGYLITYLLLTEEKKYTKLNIGKFYIRRVLRIWPLYYLIIILGLFVLPRFGLFQLPGENIDFLSANRLPVILMLIFFLPNLVLAKFGAIPFVAPTWSIGTEEQFYLIWPVLLQKVKQYRIAMFFMLITIYMLIRLSLEYANPGDHLGIQIFKNYWSLFHIDSLIIGALFAVIHFNKNRVFGYLSNIPVLFSSLAVIILLLVIGIENWTFQYELYSVCFALVIFNLVTVKKAARYLEWKPLRYLGKISYGLYLYHGIIVVGVLRILLHFKIAMDWIIYPAVFLGTILTAGISFRYFEAIFLRLKAKYSVIKT